MSGFDPDAFLQKVCAILSIAIEAAEGIPGSRVYRYRIRVSPDRADEATGEMEKLLDELIRRLEKKYDQDDSRSDRLEIVIGHHSTHDTLSSNSHDHKNSNGGRKPCVAH
ncbi:MAG: hypothetical protein L0220_22955 [Acidobacteria bacterium]|nr:hypothetical protein [Acidobacteriota bacterium]